MYKWLYSSRYSDADIYNFKGRDSLSRLQQLAQGDLTAYSTVAKPQLYIDIEVVARLIKEVNPEVMCAAICKLPYQLNNTLGVLNNEITKDLLSYLQGCIDMEVARREIYAEGIRDEIRPLESDSLELRI